MTMAATIPLGAPGIYESPDVPLRGLTNVRMDVCAFVGIAPRGPSRVRWNPWSLTAELEHETARFSGPRRSVPQLVESWDEYVRWFGGFEGPGLLPYAVASFFEQGGRRAYVVRIVHDYHGPSDNTGVALGSIRGLRPIGGAPRHGLPLVARNEGSWGNALRAALSFTAMPIRLEQSGDTVILDRDVSLPEGSVIRLHFAGLPPRLFTVVHVEEEWHRSLGAKRVQRATLDSPIPSALVRAELVEAELELWEADPEAKTSRRLRNERHAALGLSPRHPRWLARVLYEESHLVYPHECWMHSDLVLPGPMLEPCPARDGQFRGGKDRWRHVIPDDFFDDGWLPSDEGPANGIHALLGLGDLSLLVVPDLYSPNALPERSDIRDGSRMAGAAFDCCVHVEPRPQQRPAEGLTGLRLDPRVPAERATIGRLQQRVVELAEFCRGFIALLDVPPGLSHIDIVRWRRDLSSEFAAAYHPWLLVSRVDDRRAQAVPVNPAAVAAGIIAQREEARGVAYGPANIVAAGVVNVTELVPAARHDELHPLGVNVYLRDRDGVRLTGARTLAGRPEYRQLSVRRLVTMIERTIEQQMQWTVFEPNNAMLRVEIERMLTGLLRALFDGNAFAGTTEEDSFFVRCDETLNPAPVLDAGRLIIEVGIAPAEPIEFIVLRIGRDGDGVLRIQD
jgi:hypothetical protein